MTDFRYKTADSSVVNNKPQVYFCSHPADFKLYFDIISDTFLSEADCTVVYRDEPATDDTLKEKLTGIKLVTVPVTSNLIHSPNEVIDTVIPFANSCNIPVLPIILENGLEDEFYRISGATCSLKLENIRKIDDSFRKNLKILLNAYLFPKKSEGSWIFLSHSSADIEKVRIIRNEFEKNKQNPLAFHLKCLRTDTKEGCLELEDLIKREIDARDWFVFCESEAAKKSEYVNMEKNYVIERGKKRIYSIDMSLPVDKILEKVNEICKGVKLFISYRKRHTSLIRLLTNELLEYDFDVWYDERLVPGENFHSIIEKKLNIVSKSGFFIAVITEGYEESYCGQYELPMAIKNNSKIIPILIGDVEIPELLKKYRCCRIPSLPRTEDIRLIAKLIEAEARRQIKGPICQSDAYNIISEISEKLNYENR